MSDKNKDSEKDSAGPVKDKFREALERKRGQQAERAADVETREGTKIHSERAAAGGKRTFRRKSGG